MTAGRARTVARWVRAAAAAVFVGVGLGCPEKPVGPAGGTPLRSIVVSPDTGRVAVGSTQAFTAVGLNAAGDTISGLTFYWSSATPSTATISSSTGVTTGVTVGSTQVAASAQGISGYATVSVIPKAIDTVIVVPTNATLRIATTTQLSDTIKDISGHVVAASPAWVSDNAAIASVDGNGLVTARALGVAHITASYGGKSGTSTITVSQVPVRSVVFTSTPPSIFIGQTTTVVAQAEDSVGNVLSGRVIRYQSQNVAVATVDSVAGVVTGVAAGTAGIVAVSEGVSSAPLTVTVATAPPSTVVLSPSVSPVHVGQSVTLTATVTNNLGQVISNPTVNFTSTNNNIASTASPAGATAVFTTGPQTGTATITGTDGAATGTATIIVSLVGVDSVHVSAAQDTLILGQMETLAATPYDSNGNVLTGRPVTWTSSNTSVATITSPAGVVTAKGAGTAVMFATINGVTGSLAMVVNQVPVATVIVVPAVDTILPLGQVQLSDTLKDASGNVLTGRPVTWTSANNSIATVSSTGLVTGTGQGTVQITASSGTASGTNTTVVLAPVQTVTVTPPTSTITTAQTAQFTATLQDASGNTLTGRTVVWSSSNPTIMVSSTGLVTPSSPTDTATNVTITATVNQPTGARSGTASLTVTLVPVASVVVYPSPDTIWATAPLNTVQLNDSTKDAGGNNLPNRPVTWTPTSGGVATVNASGLVTSTNTAAGSATITATASNGPNASGTVVVLGHSQTVNVIQETPGPLSLSMGPLSVQVYATILDSFGNDVSASRLVTWTSSDPTSVTITQGGINASGRPIGAGMTGAIVVTAIADNSSPVTITVTTTDPGPVVVTGTTSIIINP